MIILYLEVSQEACMASRYVYCKMMRCKFVSDMFSHKNLAYIDSLAVVTSYT